MKKSAAVTVGVLVLAGAWLGSTWYTGKKLETETTARLALANEQLAQVDPELELVLSQISFERSLFNSEARYALSVGEKGKAEPEFRLEFDTHYEHGPFPAAALAQGHLMPALAFVRSKLANTEDSKQWFEATQGKTPVTSDLLLSYNGDAKFDTQFAAANVKDEEDVLEFAGAELKGTFQAKNQRAKGSLIAPKLVLDVETEESGQVVLNLADSQLEFDAYENAFGIQSGTAELRIAKLSLRQDEDTEVSIDKLVYGANSSEDDTFMRGAVYLSAGATVLNGQALGSQSMTFKMDKLDGRALKLVSDAYNRTVAEGQKDSDNMDALLQAAKTLLNANPTLALDNFSWTTDKGSSTLAVHSEWQAPANLNGPSSILLAQSVKAVNMDLSLNKTMATNLTSRYLQATEGLDAEQADALAALQLDEAIGAMSMMGLLKEDGDTFKSHVEFDGAKITVNGGPLPPEVLMGLMMAM